MTNKEAFMSEYAFKHENMVVTTLVVAIELPTGSIEVITNINNIPEKMKYYKDKYNDCLRLIANEKVCIKGWLIT